MSSLPKILLHICCAPCSPHIITELSKQYSVSAFFYNPNIQPEEEYILREKEIRRFSENEGFTLLVGEYEPGEWNRRVTGLENEPEGGRRCDACFLMRLEKTAQAAAISGIEFFTTTLSISPHKNAAKINAAGRSAAAGSPGTAFIEADFKKHDGFRISSELSRRQGFYRQNYCGCIHSKKR